MNTRPKLRLLLAIAFIAMLGIGPIFGRAQETTHEATTGYGLHIDAKYHFPGDGQAIAHHFCKEVSGGLTQCQIYDGEGADARLVGMEYVVSAEMYQTFPAEEQAFWHYHRDEIPLVEATIMDLTEAEAAPIAEGLMETYGKVYLIWDPTTGDLPFGQPFVPDIHSNVMATP